MKYLTIKLSHLNVWDGNYKIQSPSETGVWDGNTFDIMSESKDCDFWFIHEGISEIKTVNCNRNNCILIIGEEKDKKNYNPEYLNQFGAVVTTREDLKHENIIKWHYICPWHVKKSFDELCPTGFIKKSNNLSVICSDLTTVSGHKNRFAFVNKMIGHFKDKIHVYGRGFNYINDKYDGLAPYKYSIAIENSVFRDYFTEKITDCFVSETMPIYYGCPNIKDYFPPESMILIDINDYKSSILLIEKAIHENFYAKYYEQILTSKTLVLNKYNIYNAIISIIENNKFIVRNNSSKTTILPERYFDGNAKKVKNIYLLKQAIKKIIYLKS